MNSRPLYAIRETWPTYCPFTDGLTGSKSRIVRYCNTREFAIKMAGVLHDRDYENCGESDFHAYDDNGKRIFAPDPQAVPGAEPFWAADDFMPF